jgi:hypothetical protein
VKAPRQPFSVVNTDDGCDGRPKYSSPVTSSLHETLVAFLEDIFITRKLYNEPPDRKQHENSIQLDEMRFLHAVKGSTQLSHIRNVKVREELGVKPVLTQIR